ncbi:MAG: helix-turn-helix domain-containing protein [Leptolyngbya sp. UWPOB_LEPTO1]|uniref:helix-turn-helix domain-containing protein n=1 Tax=Leptolyngbya sp. UWPOB_LEPTO1 TaxID=2815653 RepID=UPI001ACC1016|nr:helix-turn-helix domain-containing protein [Leptolyngbya sp. UWPOB_LEPTO1]MBN8560883.1 helix-turn-helix domain-containing protein [Leptolyngbya sp. UWPOB_LEPTO1]
MKTGNLLSQQIQTMNVKILDLYKNSKQTPTGDFFSIALKELGVVSEELEVAVEELNRQSEVLDSNYHDIYAERLRYQNLFEFAPDCYLVTDIQGKIQDVNLAAAALLNRRSQHLIDKPFSVLIALEDRHRFRTALTDVVGCDHIQFSAKLQYNAHQQFDARITVDTIRAQGKLLALRWIISEPRNCEPEATTDALSPANFEPRSLLQYNRGEIIPLAAQSIWLVTQGVVKLCSFTETGEEVLVGIVAERMVFGKSLTSLPIYQAMALSSEVKLVSVSLLELGQSATLAQALVPLITQRLQQTERLLTLHGQLRVSDRLIGLLTLFAQEIGEPTSEGIRLKARLTHQDIANACSTTRVTITRLLNRLQEEGMIQFDSSNHIILRASI